MQNLRQTSMDIVTILILIDGFLQYFFLGGMMMERRVTILILIDGFLQYSELYINEVINMSHNPYFNRWFSAISKKYLDTPIKDSSQSLF